MILTEIVHQFLLFIWNTVQFLPAFTVLPLGMSDALLSASNIWYGFLNVFWPLQIVWTCALWYMGFKIALLTLKLIWGDRIPDSA